MQRRVFLAFAVLLCLPVVAQSAVIIVGDHALLPNTPNQHVEIIISGPLIGNGVGAGNGDINGMNLSAKVGDGNQLLSTTVAQEPAITAEDVLGAAGFNLTIFGPPITGNNQGASISFAPGATKRIVEVGTIANLPDGGVDVNLNPTFYTVSPNGLFGTLVFDTTGIFAGPLQKTWNLGLGQVPIVPGPGTSDIGTDLNTDPLLPSITDGHVFIAAAPIPEPSSIVLALFAAAGLAAVAIRRRRCA